MFFFFCEFTSNETITVSQSHNLDTNGVCSPSLHSLKVTFLLKGGKFNLGMVFKSGTVRAEISSKESHLDGSSTTEL